MLFQPFLLLSELLGLFFWTYSRGTENPTALLSPFLTWLRVAWTSLSPSEICSPWFLGDPFHCVGWFYRMILSFLEFVYTDSLVSLNFLSEFSSMISNFSSQASSSSVETSLLGSWFDFTCFYPSSLDSHQSLKVALWSLFLRCQSSNYPWYLVFSSSCDLVEVSHLSVCLFVYLLGVCALQVSYPSLFPFL